MSRFVGGLGWLVVLCASMAWGGEPKSGEIARVRKLDRWVDLSGGERPVAILCPERPAYRAAAKRIAEAIERLGGRRPSVSSDPEKTTPQTHSVIALGNVNNNRLIARLYFNGYAYEDSLLPGRGGWSLRTVYDPYPWHGRGDVIVVGVSDERDASQAAEALIRHVEKGKTKAGVGYLLEVSTAGKLTPSERRVLDSKRSPSFFTFLYSASRYLKTGQEAYARHAIETLERIVQRYRRDPKSDCDWPEETNSADILATWDAFEECPLLSDEQRLRFTQAFLRFMRSLRRHVSGYSRIGRGDLVTWNHTTFPLLGMYFGSRYFRDYYALPEADEYLAKARACFLAQARSWKPQEDADTYLIITMGHTVRYCLAEWQLEFFQSGRARQFGDYVISVCDSRGWLSGFGDSGIGRSSFLIRRAIPTLFWWYRDPGYLWVLEHVTEGKWRNPFHRDVKSRRPDRLVGLLVFPLDRQLYEYTRRRPFYGGPPAPPNVPPEAAFDKIAFRESWDKDAQYLLLDGFGRGKHLHFDTNAIIVLVDRGERWLIDHDYLTRNTTEHNMLSVIRDGRADRLVPSCAGLICESDVGGRIGLVSTEVRDYCGVDWRRSIFWLKGGPLVVLDRMTARKPADYDLDLVWKLEDRGDERLVDDHTFLARRLEVPWQTRAVTVVDDSSASGGKTAVLGQGGSVLAVAVDLPPGEYRLAVRAYGQDTGSDSLFAHTPDGTTVTVGTPRLKYGPNDPAGALRSAVPVKLTGTKRQLMSLSLRERPPVRVDRLFFFDRRGRLQLAVEAEEAPQPTETDIATVPAKRFWIKWPDAPELTVKRGHPKGIVVPVCKLYQRMSRRLAAGESVELANVLYTDEASRPRRFSIERIGRGAVLLTGGEPALCAVGDANVDGLAFDAEMLYLSPTRIAWAGGRSLRFGALRLTSRSACNLEFDLTGKEVTARSPDGNPVKVQTSGVSGRAVRELLARLGKTVHAGGQGDTSKSKSAGSKQPARRASVQPAWTLKLPESGSVRRLKRADLDGDGRPELLVAAGNRACAVSAAGRLLWSYSLAGTCYDIEAGELAADRPGLEVAVAGGDTYVHVLDARGKLLSKHQVRGAVWNQNFGDRPWQAYTVGVRDLDQDGTNEILVGTQNYELHLYDATWKMLARTRRAVLHGSIDFLTADADGDGKLEIFATDHYGRVQAFQHDGTKAAAFYTSIGDMQAALADLDGDGRIELVYGSSTGDLVATKLPSGRVSNRGAKTLWRFDNFGYAVNRLRAADLDADGKPEVAVASGSGYLYVLGSGGKVKWQDRAGTDIVETVFLQDAPARLAYLDLSGTLTLASGDGSIRKRLPLAIAPRVALPLRGTLVIGSDGQLSAFSIRDMLQTSGWGRTK